MKEFVFSFLENVGFSLQDARSDLDYVQIDSERARLL